MKCPCKCRNQIVNLVVEENASGFKFISGSVEFIVKKEPKSNGLRYDLEMSWEYEDEKTANKMIGFLSQ